MPSPISGQSPLDRRCEDARSGVTLFSGALTLWERLRLRRFRISENRDLGGAGATCCFAAAAVGSFCIFDDSVSAGQLSSTVNRFANPIVNPG